MWVSKNKMCSRTWRQSVAIDISAQLPIIRECGACEQRVIYVCSLIRISMIAYTDMKNVYNHTSGIIKGTNCALHQCVRVVPVPARMLKLGTMASDIHTGLHKAKSASTVFHPAHTAMNYTDCVLYRSPDGKSNKTIILTSA